TELFGLAPAAIGLQLRRVHICVQHAIARTYAAHEVQGAPIAGQARLALPVAAVHRWAQVLRGTPAIAHAYADEQITTAHAFPIGTIIAVQFACGEDDEAPIGRKRSRAFVA